MKKVSGYAFLALGFVCFAAFGYAMGRYTAPSSGAEVKVVEFTAPVVTTVVPDQSERMQALLRKLADAEKLIDELVDEPETASEQAPPAVERKEEVVNERREPQESREAMMERLKTEDPVRFAEMQKEIQKRTEEREARRKEAEKVQARKDEFFANVNIAYMSPEEQQKLATFVAQYQQLRAMSERPREEGVEIDRDKERELRRSVYEMSGEIRTSLLKATAKEMGYSDADSTKFTEVIAEIYSSTRPDMGHMMGGWRGQGGGRRDRGGNR
jgi:phage terminase small subunit